MLDVIEKVNGDINSWIWGEPALVLLVGTGIIISILTKFFQVTNFKLWWTNTIGKMFKKQSGATKSNVQKSISQFQALCTALAATVGTGNIAGVAAAIATGGPGAVFWMWVAAFFGMMTHYAENVLGIFYRRKNKDGEWCGGPMYYLRDGLGRVHGCKYIGRILSVLFCIFAILASFGIGNLAQANTISTNIAETITNIIKSVNPAFVVPQITIGQVEINVYMLVTGIVLLLLAALVVVGGLKRLAAVTEKLVPAMVVIYVIGSLVIIACNITKIGAVFASIFQFAFGFKAIAGALVGEAVKNAITIGCKRGVFSNEAGLGSSIMVHSASDVKEPVVQGMWGIFEVFADTMVVCTMTALTVLSSGVVDLSTGEVLTGGTQTVLVADAFSTVFGSFGSVFISISIFMFAFSTILGWSYYGTKAWEYVFGTKSTIIYKVFFVVLVVVSASLPQQYISLPWDISDTFNGLMMIPNLIGVLTLSGTVYKITKNYRDRKLRGKDEKPMLSAFEDI